MFDVYYRVCHAGYAFSGVKGCFDDSWPISVCIYGVRVCLIVPGSYV